MYFFADKEISASEVQKVNMWDFSSFVMWKTSYFFQLRRKKDLQKTEEWIGKSNIQGQEGIS